MFGYKDPHDVFETAMVSNLVQQLNTAASPFAYVSTVKSHARALRKHSEVAVKKEFVRFCRSFGMLANPAILERFYPSLFPEDVERLQQVRKLAQYDCARLVQGFMQHNFLPHLFSQEWKRESPHYVMYGIQHHHHYIHQAMLGNRPPLYAGLPDPTALEVRSLIAFERICGLPLPSAKYLDLTLGQEL